MASLNMYFVLIFVYYLFQAGQCGSLAFAPGSHRDIREYFALLQKTAYGIQRVRINIVFCSCEPSLDDLLNSALDCSRPGAAIFEEQCDCLISGNIYC